MQVQFDGRPAPIIYTSEPQASVVVPYDVAGQATTQLRLIYQGVISSVVTLPVTVSVPGIFTLDASGSGPGAIFNQDFTLNSAFNPAPRGSVIQLFATGEGLTDPAGIDGRLAQTPLPMPIAPVAAQIGGVDAVVYYAGGAPGLTAGLMQVNLIVPAGVTPGPTVPVVISVGGVPSQTQVTVAVN
jgi:uncharacterized protein (TIGR03437 family)